jgi:hypothetical protein
VIARSPPVALGRYGAFHWEIDEMPCLGLRLALAIQYQGMVTAVDSSTAKVIASVPKLSVPGSASAGDFNQA